MAESTMSVSESKLYQFSSSSSSSTSSCSLHSIFSCDDAPSFHDDDDYDEYDDIYDDYDDDIERGLSGHENNKVYNPFGKDNNASCSTLTTVMTCEDYSESTLNMSSSSLRLRTPSSRNSPETTTRGKKLILTESLSSMLPQLNPLFNCDQEDTNRNEDGHQQWCQGYDTIASYNSKHKSKATFIIDHKTKTKYNDDNHNSSTPFTTRHKNPNMIEIKFKTHECSMSCSRRYTLEKCLYVVVITILLWNQIDLLHKIMLPSSVSSSIQHVDGRQETQRPSITSLGSSPATNVISDENVVLKVNLLRQLRRGT